MDRSSVSITPPTNPYDERGVTTPHRHRTPTGPMTPVSDKATPTSMVRNLFAKKVVSPVKTPSKRPAWPPPNTHILEPSKRSAAPWISPSPEDKDESPSKATPRPTVKVKQELQAVTVKSEFEEIGAKPPDDEVATLFAPAQQYPSEESASTEKEEPVDPPQSSPTQLNEPIDPGPTAVREAETSLPVSDDPTRVASAEEPKTTERPKKRVRMAGPIDEPDNPFTEHFDLSQRSQASHHSQLSQRSASSAHSGPTINSDSTAPSILAKGVLQFHLLPPTAREVMGTMESQGIPTVVYQEPYYSNPVDVPPRAKMFAGRMFALKGSAVEDLPEFDVLGITPKSRKWLKIKRTAVVSIKHGWEYGLPPPRLGSVVSWCQQEDEKILEQSGYPR